MGAESILSHSETFPKMGKLVKQRRINKGLTKT